MTDERHSSLSGMNTAKFYRPCRALQVDDKIDDYGRDAVILEIKRGFLNVACLLRYEDNGEEAWRHYSVLWQPEMFVQRYEEVRP